MTEIGRKILNFKVFIWLYQSLIADRERWPLWMPVLLGCGIGLYFALPFEPELWISWTAFTGLGFVAWGLRAHSGGASMAVWAVAFVVLGVGLSGVRTWLVAAPVLQKEFTAVMVEGQVVRIEARPKGLRVTLNNLTIERLRPDQTPQNIRVTLSAKQPQFGPGDWLRMRASLSPPPRPAAPGAFDFQRQSYFRGLGAVGFSYGRVDVSGLAPTQGLESLSFALERLRSTIGLRVRESLGGDSGAVASALMTGDRGAISKSVLQDMRSSGLAHLLAISGLHVGLISGIVFFMIRAVLALIGPLALNYPIKKWAALVAISGAGAYALLAGATVPTQRAFLMIALVFIAVLFDRRALSMRSVAWAALVILVVAPESLTGASFQLSFAAVVALIAVYEGLRGTRFFRAKSDGVGRAALRYLGSVAITTLVAGLATAVFAAFHFNRVADFSLLANLVAVPITALWIMPWAVVAYALMPLGLESLGLTPMGWGVDVVLATANWVAHLPGAVSAVPAFPLWGLVVVSLSGLWVAIWSGRWRFLGVPMAALGLSSMLWSVSPDVLIDSTGKLVATKTQTGGYTVSTLRAKKFERDVWLRRAGLMVADGHWKNLKPSFSQKPSQVKLACDALGCLYVNGRQTIAFAKTPEALSEDCEQAQVLVGLDDFGREDFACKSKLVIRYQDLKKNGAHALYFINTENKTGSPENATVRVETVRELRGNRPWVLKTGVLKARVLKARVLKREVKPRP
ncbi:MAG: metal-binding protein [Rhodospirillaceae bacterium]|nr:MAG: metal-binding protein [Rhodospirillaceae bacterium]